MDYIQVGDSVFVGIEKCHRGIRKSYFFVGGVLHYPLPAGTKVRLTGPEVPEKEQRWTIVCKTVWENDATTDRTTFKGGEQFIVTARP